MGFINKLLGGSKIQDEFRIANSLNFTLNILPKKVEYFTHGSIVLRNLYDASIIIDFNKRKVQLIGSCLVNDVQLCAKYDIKAFEITNGDPWILIETNIMNLTHNKVIIRIFRSEIMIMSINLIPICIIKEFTTDRI